MSRLQKTRLSVGGIVIMLAVILIPLEIPHSISTQGKMLPAKSWVLLRNDNGMIVSVLRDNRTGNVQRYDITHLERGDALSFTLSDRLASGFVDAGDTVAWTYSTDIEYEIATLRGALEVAEAAYASAATGEKPSLVREAEQRLQYARKAEEEQRAVFRRQAELHRKDLISDEEYERAEDQLDMLRINVSIAEAHLAVVSSGLKEADVLHRKKEIEAIRGELRAMERRLALASHVAPLSGRIRPLRAPDTLLVIDDDTETLLFMPVELEQVPTIPDDAGVEFTAGELGVSGSATVVHGDRPVSYFDGHAISMVMARVTRQDGGIPHGLLVRCSVTAEPQTIWEALISFVSGLLE